MSKKLLIGLAGLIVGAVLGAMLVSNQSAPVQNGSLGAVNTTVDEYPSGVRFGDIATVNWAGGDIGQSANQAYWLNTLGRPVYMDLAEVISDGTASSAMRVSVGTSTATRITDDFAAPYSTLVDNAAMATGSVKIILNSQKDAGTNGRSAIVVQANEYVNVTLRQDRTGACTGATCETSTSTNRGFNLKWRLRYHY
jgi:hypothetical protein